jgi:hypothetical protein
MIYRSVHLQAHAGICNVIISRLVHLQTPVGKLQCNNIQVNTAANLSSEIPAKGNCKCIWEQLHALALCIATSLIVKIVALEVKIDGWMWAWDIGGLTVTGKYRRRLLGENLPSARTFKYSSIILTEARSLN